MVIYRGHDDAERIDTAKQLPVVGIGPAPILAGYLLGSFGIDIGNPYKLTLWQRCIYAGMMLAKVTNTNYAYTDLLHEKLTACLSAV